MEVSMKGLEKLSKKSVLLLLAFWGSGVEAYFTDYLFNDTTRAGINFIGKGINLVNNVIFSDTMVNSANAAISIAELAINRDTNATNKIGTVANIFAPFFFQSEAGKRLRNRVIQKAGDFTESLANPIFSTFMSPEEAVALSRNRGEYMGQIFFNSVVHNLGLRQGHSIEELLGRLGGLSHNYGLQRGIQGKNDYGTYAKLADTFKTSSQVVGAGQAIYKGLLTPAQDNIDRLINVASNLTPYAEQALEGEPKPATKEQIENRIKIQKNLNALLTDPSLMKYVDAIDEDTRKQLQNLYIKFHKASREKDGVEMEKIRQKINSKERLLIFTDLTKERATSNKTKPSKKVDLVLIQFLGNVKKEMKATQKQALEELRKRNQLIQKTSLVTQGV